jgi:hypothetical protein
MLRYLEYAHTREARGAYGRSTEKKRFCIRQTMASTIVVGMGRPKSD